MESLSGESPEDSIAFRYALDLISDLKTLCGLWNVIREHSIAALLGVCSSIDLAVLPNVEHG